jgi:hypothetical protein
MGAFQGKQHTLKFAYLASHWVFQFIYVAVILVYCKDSELPNIIEVGAEYYLL